MKIKPPDLTEAAESLRESAKDEMAWLLVGLEDDGISKWDARFLSLADFVATWSEDQSRKIGAVIVNDRHSIVSVGYNGLPRKVLNYPERNERPDKYMWFEHAERNAIYNAASLGVSLLDCTIYSNLFPCADCARGIIQSGIKRIVSYHAPVIDVYAKSFELSKIMLEEADVSVVLIDK